MFTKENPGFMNINDAVVVNDWLKSEQKPFQVYHLPISLLIQSTPTALQYKLLQPVFDMAIFFSLHCSQAKYGGLGGPLKNKKQTN